MGAPQKTENIACYAVGIWELACQPEVYPNRTSAPPPENCQNRVGIREPNFWGCHQVPPWARFALERPAATYA